jgi:hypothetical protein
MAKVTINDKGVVVEKGNGLTITSPTTFVSAPVAAVSALVSSSAGPLSVSGGGVFTITGSAVAEVVMPLAAACPGATFVFRNLSLDAHYLTGSAEANGTKVFAGMAGAAPDNQGSKLTLEGTVGKSVALVSDGLSFLVMAASGSCTLSGT